MNGLRTWFGRQPLWARWASLGALALVVALAGWFFVIRPQGGGNPLVVTPPPPRPALGKPVTFSQYTGAVEQALIQVREAKGLSGDARSKKAQDAAATLDAVEGAGVALAGGENAPAQVDNTEIITALREKEPPLDAIESGLDTLYTSLQAATATQSIPGTKGAAEANADLRSVLGDPLFNYDRSLTPLQRLARWLAQFSGNADPEDIAWRWMTSLMAAVAAGVLTWLGTERVKNRWARLGISAGVGLGAGTLFYAAVGNLNQTVQLLAALGLAVAALASMLIITGLNRASSPPAPRHVSELAAVLGMGAGEARKRADEAAASGDFRLATRYRCLAVLLALDEAGKLIFDRAATNREYLFRAQGALHDALQPLLDGFDAIWYGEKPTGASEYAQYSQRAAAIEAEVAAEARTQQASRLQRSPA